jgi:multidrug efflux system membrane fusion protein
VLVPVTAVRVGPQGDYVYVVDAQQVAHMRAVERGLATDEQILITRGLRAGERVVTEGGDRVKDGGRVQLAGQPPAGGASAPKAASSAPASSAAAAGDCPERLSRLPPDLCRKVMAMPPDERRAYLQQLRQARQARGQ